MKSTDIHEKKTKSINIRPNNELKIFKGEFGRSWNVGTSVNYLVRKPIGVSADKDAGVWPLNNLHGGLAERERLSGAVRSDDEDRRSRVVKRRVHDAGDGFDLPSVQSGVHVGQWRPDSRHRPRGSGVVDGRRE